MKLPIICCLATIVYGVCADYDDFEPEIHLSIQIEQQFKLSELIKFINLIQDPNNVIETPDKCPEGEKPDANGKCRPIWDYLIHPKNVIDVPTKCPEGEKPDQNGKCRPVWDFFRPASVIDVPDKCGEGEKPDANGKCRPIWDSLNVIETPDKCPPGEKPDANGKCRPIWDKSMLDVLRRVPTGRVVAQPDETLEDGGVLRRQIVPTGRLVAESYENSEEN